MPELSFTIEGVEAPAHAAAPLLQFGLRIRNAVAGEQVHAVILHAQVQIEAHRRRYQPDEQPRLLDLFGETDRWGTTLRSLLWTHANASVPPFEGDVTMPLAVPCTYDFEVAGAKYFHALADGEIPLTFLFSGTIFYEAADGALQVAQIPWDREATFQMPLAVWRQMMDLYFPNSAWLRLRRDTFDRLDQYRQQRGMPSWEQALDSLLAETAVRP